MAILAAEDGGVASAVSDLIRELTGSDRAAPELGIALRNIASDTAERSGDSAYPALCVYCERMVNDLREKFRTFAGTVTLAVDVRVTGDRAEGLDGLLHTYVDGVTEVLDRARGQWQDGVYYPGGYEVAFAAAKKGGKNFLQTAKVRLDVIVSL